MTLSNKKKITRYIQKYLVTLEDKARFTTSHISLGGKITLFGIILCFIALFLPWIASVDSIAPVGNQRVSSLSSFSSLLGYSGVFIFAVLGIMIFALFSIIKKQKLHAVSLIHLSADMVGLWGSLFIIVFCLHSFFLISGLQFFSANIIYGKGLILCMTGGIIIFIGSIMMMQEDRKNVKGSYVSEVDAHSENSPESEKKKNMKLPF